MWRSRSNQAEQPFAGVLKRLEEVRQLTVEKVQDQVEQQLMAEGYYETAKAYILYREKRAKARAMRERIAARMEDPSLEGTLREIEADFDSAKYSLNLLAEQYERLIREGMSVREQEKILVKAAIELTTMEAPRWEYLAARLQNHFFSRTVREEMQKQNIQTFPEKLHDLADEGLYGRYILEAYSEEELQMAGDMIMSGTGSAVYIRRIGAASETLCDPYTRRKTNGNTTGDVPWNCAAPRDAGNARSHGVGTAVLRYAQPDGGHNGHTNDGQCQKTVLSALQLLCGCGSG